MTRASSLRTDGQYFSARRFTHFQTATAGTRLMPDLLIELLGGEPFSWGGGSPADVGELRARYVAALRAAANHDIGPLLEFARSWGDAAWI
jgi:hypothetical protein